MDFLSNEWFQSVGIPLVLAAIAQVLFLLSRHSQKPRADDFSSLPYSLGVASLGINATFALTKHANIENFYGFTLLIFFSLIAVAIIQRLFRKLWLVNLFTVAFQVFFMALTFAIWRNV